MSVTIMNRTTLFGRVLPFAATAAALVLSAVAHAAAPGITGTTFNLIAQPSNINQPDGAQVYSWGYGCNGAPAGGFLPAAISKATCPTMQIPGPTLIVTEGQTITVNLTNALPAAAGNTSILFPGFQVTAAALPTQPPTCRTRAAGLSQGLLTSEVTNGCTI